MAAIALHFYSKNILLSLIIKFFCQYDKIKNTCRATHANNATAGGVNMKLPEGELISSNRIVSTRAINIKAAKEKVWPWISQTGHNCGGFNS